MKPAFIERLPIALLTNAGGTHQLNVVVSGGRVIIVNVDDFPSGLVTVWANEKRFLGRHRELRGKHDRSGLLLVKEGPDLRERPTPALAAGLIKRFYADFAVFRFASHLATATCSD
jgi:hypothetical protein